MYHYRPERQEHTRRRSLVDDRKSSVRRCDCDGLKFDPQGYDMDRLARSLGVNPTDRFCVAPFWSQHLSQLVHRGLSVRESSVKTAHSPTPHFIGQNLPLEQHFLILKVWRICHSDDDTLSRICRSNGRFSNDTFYRTDL